MSTKALDKLRTDLQGRLEGLQNDYDEQENALADAANKWMNADRCLEQSEQVTRLQPYLEQLATRCKETEEKSWIGLHDR